MSTVTVVPTVDATNVPPRVRLDVTDTGNSPAVTATTVNRLGPDGSLVPVRTADGNPLTLTTSGSDRVGLLYDYEMPYGAAVSYTTAESPAVMSAQVTVAEKQPWLIHPGVPALSMPILIVSTGDRVRKVQRGIHYPMGRAAPVVVTTGTRNLPEYSLRVRTTTAVQRIALETLLFDAAALLLNVPAGLGWGIGAEYVSIGDYTESRLYEFGPEPRRNWELPCIVVDRPTGGSQAQRTYVDLLNFPTYAAMQAAYPSYTALLAGP